MADTPSEPIRVAYAWTVDTWCAAHRLYLRSVANHPLVWLVRAFALFLYYMAWQSWTAHHGDGPRWAWPLFFAVMGTFFLFGLRPLQVAGARRRFAKRPDRDREVVHVVDESGVATEVERLASSRVGWDHYVQAVIGEEGLLLFLTPRQYQWFPANGAASDADRRRLVECVEARVPRTRVLR